MAHRLRTPNPTAASLRSRIFPRLKRWKSSRCSRPTSARSMVFPGASVVNMITRSGTNQFHGSVYDFFRDDSLDANDWFAIRNGDPIPALRRNNYGFTFGGPIIKNKTFFFVDYDGLRSIRVEQKLPRACQPTSCGLVISVNFVQRKAVTSTPTVFVVLPVVRFGIHTREHTMETAVERCARTDHSVQQSCDVCQPGESEPAGKSSAGTRGRGESNRSRSAEDDDLVSGTEC